MMASASDGVLDRQLADLQYGVTHVGTFRVAVSEPLGGPVVIPFAKECFAFRVVGDGIRCRLRREVAEAFTDEVGHKAG